MKRAKQPVVETIQQKDHVIFVPPATLRERAMRMTPGGAGDAFDFSALERAEKALAELAEDFSGWMRDEAERIEVARVAAKAKPKDAFLRDNLYRVAHDIRGHAGTFGFPLAGEIADGLCDLMDGAGDIDGPVFGLADAHIAAIRTVVRDDVRDSGDVVARTLVGELASAREAMIGVQNFEKLPPALFG